MPDDPGRFLAAGLAAAFLGGDWEPVAMADRAQHALGQRRAWIRAAALTAWHAYPEAPRDRPRALAAVVAASAPVERAVSRAARRGVPPPPVRHWYLAATEMGATRWPVPPLDTVHDLQDLLGLTTSSLRWLADPAGLERRCPSSPGRHYRYQWIPKATGGLRLLEAPKPVLKHAQRVLLRTVLSAIPPHPAAHGFTAGRSARTHAAGHVGRAVVLRLDLEDFFGSVTAGRVFGLYRACGFPEAVAHLLTALATNSVPTDVLAAAPLVTGPVTPVHRRAAQHLAHAHLPQGAPTSPALANLAAFGLDRRLSGLAARAGLVYSRYADDLALSSASRRSAAEVRRTVELVREIVAAEGFRLNEAKTAVRRAGQRQRLAGVVVNATPNVDRREYDRLRAVLTNTARSGPAGQNRDGLPDFRAHLLGRIAWVAHLNPHRGERLTDVFDRIDWSAG
ncbi:MAG TPA: reverse transcriptase family protein [Acidimicrobiales bacterium]|nr:reverse transcriptase family protein [Acidimicrobiales bacterium]